MGQRVILTGARGLIGASMSEFLQGNGWQVLELDLALGHDLSDEGFVREWFAAHRAGALVNLFALNHHVSPGALPASYLDIDLLEMGRYLETNVTTLFSVCREYVRNNESGSVVNFSSIYGIRAPRRDLYEGGEKHVGYGVSKAAVISLTQHLAILAAPRVRFNCIVPGGIQAEQGGSFIDGYNSRTLLNRMATPADLFPIVELLLSDRGAYMTGSVIHVDGGWLT